MEPTAPESDQNATNDTALYQATQQQYPIYHQGYQATQQQYTYPPIQYAQPDYYQNSNQPTGIFYNS